MYKKIMTCFTTALVLAAGTGIAWAEEDGAKVIPVEMYACTYNDGMGPGDLDKVIASWTAWADAQGMDDYAAWTLTPWYFGPDQEFDVLWLGAAKNAVALGAGQDMYLEKGGEIAQGFSEVLTCNAHVNFASVNHKRLPEGTTPSNSVLTFSNCSYKEGAPPNAMEEAMKKWVEHLDAQGSKASIFHWYPAYGGGGEKFDFKWLEAHENLAALGKDYDSFGTGGGYNLYGELFGKLIECDASRAYLAKSRRYVQLR